MKPDAGTQGSSTWEKGCGWTVLALGAIAVFAIVMPVIDCGPPHRAKLTTTISNFKQVALATHMYAVEHDDTLPMHFRSEQDLREHVMPYLERKQALRTLNPNGGSIVPNHEVAGMPLSSVVAPEVTALLNETERWPDNRQVYAFVDGHVRAVTDTSLVRTEPGVSGGLDFSMAVNPLTYKDDNALVYKFGIGDETYLLSWSHVRTFMVYVEEDTERGWEGRYEGTTMGVPHIRQSREHLKIFLPQPWFQLGESGPPPAGKDWYEVVTVDEDGVRHDLALMGTIED
ncbi:MAG: hypothetical protein WD716_09055 [Fimbriimonadaceae bacterium]